MKADIRAHNIGRCKADTKGSEQATISVAQLASQPFLVIIWENDVVYFMMNNWKLKDI